MQTGRETINAVREISPDTLLAFSRGKDALAAWLAVREHFDRVIPYHLYLVPGLEFVEESLAYYERFFGTKIIRLPHPSAHRMLNGLVFQPPEHCLVIEQAELPNHDYKNIRSAAIKIGGCDESALVADGVRSADSPMRMIALRKYGTISLSQGKYHPVWDLKKHDLVSMFRRHNVRLPIDYRLFGRTFDGLDLRFLYPIKKKLPADYARILEFFPLADLEIFRYERSLK